MRVTALIENEAPDSLEKEHGLAVHITYRGKNYLLDTGSSQLFRENARTLGIALESVDAAILSHAHYDHSGGYEAFFEENRKATVYMQEAAGESTYFKIVGPIQKYIGIPKGLLETYAPRITYVQGNYDIAEGVRLIAHTTPNLAMRGKRAHMYRKQSGRIIPDDFAHEQSLVFETKEGLVILNSCSHAGIENIVEEVKQIYPERDIAAVIGGFHLMGAMGTESLGMKEKEVEGLAKRLKEAGVHQIYTGHCTGKPGYEILERCLGKQIQYFCTGTVVEFEE